MPRTKTGKGETMESYKELLAEAVAYQREIMPKEIADIIQQCNADLFNGPSYYDSEGNESSCFDEDSSPFDFTKACDTVRDYINDIADITFTKCVWVHSEYSDDPDVNAEPEEIEYQERIDGSGEDICIELCGKELYNTL